jgi:hypothetical protein
MTQGDKNVLTCRVEQNPAGLNKKKEALNWSASFK